MQKNEIFSSKHLHGKANSIVFNYFFSVFKTCFLKFTLILIFIMIPFVKQLSSDSGAIHDATTCDVNI